MRHILWWALPVAAILVVNAGCSTTSHGRGGPLAAFSGRTATPTAAAPAQLASYQPGAAVQAPPGGYQAELASTSRAAASQRFQVPKCLTSG